MADNRCGKELTPEEYKKASKSRRLCNPGNLRYGSFTKDLGHIKVDAGNFLVFDTYEKGFNALCTFLTRACEGKFKPVYDPEMSLEAFSNKYGEPESGNYVFVISQGLGVSKDVQIKILL